MTGRANGSDTGLPLSELKLDRSIGLFRGVALVIIYYSLRVGRLKRSGVDWEQRIRGIPGFDEE